MGFNSGFNSGFATPGVGVSDPRGLTIDLSGAGGSLSNGTLSLSVKDFSGNSVGSVTATLAGIGASQTFTYFAISLSALFSSYNGSTDEVSMTIGTSSAITWGVAGAGVWGVRSAGAGTPTNGLFGLRNAGTTDRLWQAKLTTASDVTEGGQTTYDPRSFGLIATPGTTTALYSTTDYGTTPFTTAQLASGLRVATEISNGTAAATFGTGDFILIGINRFSGSGTTTITQDANGLSVANGAMIVPFERVHVYYTAAN